MEGKHGTDPHRAEILMDRKRNSFKKESINVPQGCYLRLLSCQTPRNRTYFEPLTWPQHKAHDDSALLREPSRFLLPEIHHLTVFRRDAIFFPAKPSIAAAGSALFPHRPRIQKREPNFTHMVFTRGIRRNLCYRRERRCLLLNSVSVSYP